MEELLESFLTAALGLTPESRIEEVSQLPDVPIRLNPPQESARACAAWDTERGRVVICATYHAEQSRRVKSHVLWLEWWILSDVRHEGWWRCDPKRPRDWTKGHG
jgi:hypothetical protein